jgi:hypothetical protein
VSLASGEGSHLSPDGEERNARHADGPGTKACPAEAGAEARGRGRHRPARGPAAARGLVGERRDDAADAAGLGRRRLHGRRRRRARDGDDDAGGARRHRLADLFELGVRGGSGGRLIEGGRTLTAESVATTLVSASAQW